MQKPFDFQKIRGYEKMKSSTKPFPKTKIQWLWENMEGKRALYLIGMIGTVLYNVLQLTIPYFSGKIVDLFLTGENAVLKNTFILKILMT